MPSNGRKAPNSSTAVSRTRAAVVPTATMRPPAFLVALRRSAALDERDAHSEWISWASIASALIGRKVPGPTCKVTSTTPTPRPWSRSKIRSVKCRPAVGAATEPGLAA